MSLPMASICLCVGWSIVPLKDTYIHYEKAGDQYVGRVINGLNVNVSEFGVSPPYFEFHVAADSIEGGGMGAIE